MFITFTTGVAGRATVLTEEAELFTLTAADEGGIAADFPLLLALLAPLAAPIVVICKYINMSNQVGLYSRYIQGHILPFLASMYLP